MVKHIVIIIMLFILVPIIARKLGQILCNYKVYNQVLEKRKIIKWFLYIILIMLVLRCSYMLTPKDSSFVDLKHRNDISSYVKSKELLEYNLFQYQHYGMRDLFLYGDLDEFMNSDGEMLYLCNKSNNPSFLSRFLFFEPYEDKIGYCEFLFSERYFISIHYSKDNDEVIQKYKNGYKWLTRAYKSNYLGVDKVKEDCLINIESDFSLLSEYKLKCIESSMLSMKHNL